MSVMDLLLCRTSEEEKNLKVKLDMQQGHADALEENLLRYDPREAIDPAVHSQVCCERQVAAHAWRKAQALQMQLIRVQNDRQFRSLALWVLASLVVALVKDIGTLGIVGPLIKIILGAA